MLVNTVTGRILNESIPSPILFDHCVVTYFYKSKQLFIDPTVAFQKGDLFNIYFKDYYYGLVIDENTTELTKLNVINRLNEIDVVSTYSKPDEDKSVTLSIIMKAKGYSGDYLRSFFASNSFSEYVKTRIEELDPYYEGITTDTSLIFDDTSDANAFILHETYYIPKFIKDKDKDGKRKGYYYPSILYSWVPDLKEKVVKYPYPVYKPIKIHEKIIVMGETIRNAQSEFIESKLYNFSFIETNHDSSFEIEYDFQSFSNVIQPEEYISTKETIHKINQNEEYSLEYEDTDNSTETDYSSLFSPFLLNLSIILILIGTILGAIHFL